MQRQRRLRRWTAVPLVAVAVVVAAPAAAQAAADIEGVWSFNGGQVAVQAQPDGTFKGLVIRVTRLDMCPHPVGETMWDAVRAQGDGSYWGGHQWFNSGTCAYIARGNTAFRVLTTPAGQTFLRVCFSPPENPESQPKIAPDGTNTDTARDCKDSDLVSPLALTPPKLANIATLPRATRRCRHSRSLKIRLREPAADALSSVLVSVNGRRRAQRNAQNATAPLTLTNVPRGRARVRITAQTVLGRTITGSRTYRVCRS